MAATTQARLLVRTSIFDLRERLRVTSMATMYSTTRPLMLLQEMLSGILLHFPLELLCFLVGVQGWGLWRTVAGLPLPSPTSRQELRGCKLKLALERWNFLGFRLTPSILITSDVDQIRPKSDINGYAMGYQKRT